MKLKKTYFINKSYKDNLNKNIVTIFTNDKIYKI
jgi:hypothetical protein